MPAPGAGTSFWTDRMHDAHPAVFRYGSVVVPVPDDVTTAALDEARSALDELATLAGPNADALFDALAETGDLPATVADAVLAHYHLTETPGEGWHTVVERINLYGAAIEFDLWERGHDLLDYFRGARPGGWDHLLRMLARLPMGSHFRAAVADDDELAAHLAEVYGPVHKRTGANRPPLTEFDRPVMYLHKISNQLQYLAWATFAAQAGKKKGQPPKGDKGPETADERVDFRGFLAEHDEIVGQVLKSKGSSSSGSPGSGSSGADTATPAARKALPRALGDDDGAGGGDDQPS